MTSVFPLNDLLHWCPLFVGTLLAEGRFKNDELMTTFEEKCMKRFEENSKGVIGDDKQIDNEVKI